MDGFIQSGQAWLGQAVAPGWAVIDGRGSPGPPITDRFGQHGDAPFLPPNLHSPRQVVEVHVAAAEDDAHAPDPVERPELLGNHRRHGGRRALLYHQTWP